jgi:hypothetical protein
MSTSAVTDTDDKVEDDGQAERKLEPASPPWASRRSSSSRVV